MRDVNNGWILRYTHANVASFFFIFVYAHVGRGIYYGSYHSPRTLVWTIGVIILILMMAITNIWPNWMLIYRIKLYNLYTSLNLFFSKARVKALYRIGPHNVNVLSIIICGMLGDWWADKIKGQVMDSIRFNIEQSINNSAYIHHLNFLLYELGYCSNIVPKLVIKSESKNDKRLDKTVTRFNYRLSLFTFTSFLWIYESFYIEENGNVKKKSSSLNRWVHNTYRFSALNHARWFTTSKSRDISCN